MSIIEELKSLLKKWEDIYDKAWDDNYSDAMSNCCNDIQAIIDKHDRRGGDDRRREHENDHH